MNPTANDATARNPGPPNPLSSRGYPGTPTGAGVHPVPAAAPRRSGSTLKYLIPVVALVAVVFGITFFAQYTPPSDDTIKGKE